ncbi:MAG: uracil-DNA glycosylase [Gammaproteobacteria bacterium]|nr:uracil-DNA glycosylase [Gammaproteobacteria bacterium]
MPHSSRAHLDAIGIPVWVRRSVLGAARQDQPAPPPAATAAGTATAGTAIPASRALESIDAQVRDCRKCELHRNRTHTVFGVGRPDAACMFIGEAPGAEEDARGEPFVGRAGKLLDAMLAAIGLRRVDVYIANIVKCRPPRNRDPHTDEIAACSGYLRRQIEAVSPRLLVATGRVAAQSLLATTKPIGQLRGRTYRYGEDRLPVIVMYHPAYFLRSPLEKRKGWEDLVRVRAMLSDPAAGRP